MLSQTPALSKVGVLGRVELHFPFCAVILCMLFRRANATWLWLSPARVFMTTWAFNGKNKFSIIAMLTTVVVSWVTSDWDLLTFECWPYITRGSTLKRFAGGIYAGADQTAVRICLVLRAVVLKFASISVASVICSGAFAMLAIDGSCAPTVVIGFKPALSGGIKFGTTVEGWGAEVKSKGLRIGAWFIGVGLGLRLELGGLFQSTAQLSEFEICHLYQAYLNFVPDSLVRLCVRPAGCVRQLEMAAGGCRIHCDSRRQYVAVKRSTSGYTCYVVPNLKIRVAIEYCFGPCDALSYGCLVEVLRYEVQYLRFV